jgi:uncharacterized protein (UPF0147 family)
MTVPSASTCSTLEESDKLESIPEDMSVRSASTCSTLEESDKLESTLDDMTVPSASTCSTLEESDKLEITPEDMTVPSASTCSTLEESDKLEITPEDMTVPSASTCSTLEESDKMKSTLDDMTAPSASTCSTLEESDKMESTLDDMTVPSASTCSTLEESDKMESTPEEMTVLSASTYSTLEEIDKLESILEDMSVLSSSTCSTLEESDNLENTPEDTSVQPILPSSKLEDGHNGDKSEVTAEGLLAEEKAAAVLSAQIESNGSNKMSVSTQLPVRRDIIPPKVKFMTTQTQTSETNTIDMKAIINKLHMIKVTLKEMKEIILEVFPEKKRKLTVAQQNSGKQATYFEKEMDLSSDISTETSKKSVPSNESQQSDKPQQQENLTVTPAQKYMQELVESKYLQFLYMEAPLQVFTSTVNAPKKLQASPKNTTEGSEAP